MFNARLAVLAAAFLAAACVPAEDQALDLGPFESSGYALTSAGLGPAGPSASSTDGSRTEVWAITRHWHETSSEAGIAWSANSGLNWEDKYTAWVQSMLATTTYSGNRKTFTVTSPYGKSLDVPYLECAELALTMRVLFASWYGLPFYMQAKDRGTDMYAGHFGFRTKTGRYRNVQEFRVRYEDFSGDANDPDVLERWPSDSSLRGKKLYGSGDDVNEFLGADAHAGYYFDELLLNKRVGHFLIVFLPYFGSINIADDANAYHATADSVRAGDILLKRWQKRGIGHVMLVKNVQERPGDHLLAEVASGSMPRRQAVWESPASSKMLFTNKQTGGEGENWDGDAYVDMGGGLKRFNAPFLDNGTWRQRVPPADVPNYIQWSNKTDRAARPARFAELLETPSPETLRDEILAIIAEKREHLQEHPSSCSARIAREYAFDELYALMAEEFDMSKAETDAEYRVVEDYIFAELVYNQSKTCCWNSTDRQMFDAIVGYTNERLAAGGTCETPLSFMARDGGHEPFAQWARDNGFNWVDWSADEACPQADNPTGTEADHRWTPYCDVFGDEPTPDPTPEPGADPYENNDSRGAAYVITEAGTYEGAAISTADDPDWFSFRAPTNATVRVHVEFTDSEGDIDVKMYRGGDQVDSSTRWSADKETVDAVYDGLSDLTVKVYGYDGATNDYTLTVEFEGGVDLGEPCNPAQTRDTAIEVPAGGYRNLQLCDGESDWFRLGATVSSGPVTVRWADGSTLNLDLTRSSGDAIDSDSGASGELVVDAPTGVKYLQISRTSGGGVTPYELFVSTEPPE